MTQPYEFQIDLNEEFEILPNAPIAEAVIHWRARAVKDLEPSNFQNKLNKSLPKYSQPQLLRQVEMQAEIGPSGSGVQLQQDSWHGFRLDSADKLHVAQFTRDGFVFSRLKPYENWALFEAEAQRLWNIYLEIAEPRDVQRLGVRFINLISPVQPERFSDLLTIPPKCPERMQMPIQGLMHKTTFDFPGHPYNLNVIQAMQPPISSQTESYELILDIDVFTTHALEPKEELLKHHLNEMRWIKNKAFFTFLTEDAIKTYRE